jgi:hypothetical protein
MTQQTVESAIPFDVLTNSITRLSFEDKRKLWEILDAQVSQAEIEALEQDPAVQAQVQEARAAYQTGDYVTLDDYAAQRRKQTQ